MDKCQRLRYIIQNQKRILFIRFKIFIQEHIICSYSPANPDGYDEDNDERTEREHALWLVP